MSSEVLEYIGLDLNEENKNLENSKPEFNITKSYDNNMLYKVYRYVPIKDIDILISYTDRTTDIKERYTTAKSINEFIKENREQFEEVLSYAKIKDIEEIENMQKEFEKHIPYFIKFEKNYLWQIYYSKESNRYFMLFPARDRETSVLFYLIKKKIENSDEKIYVPICKEDCSEDLLKREQLTDIENYIWLFTKTWPKIYEVNLDQSNILYVTGETKIKEGFTSKYIIKIDSKDSAEIEYTLLKALFILNTEANYKFIPVIDDLGRLRFEYDNEIIQMENLSSFIENQVKVIIEKIKKCTKDFKHGDEKLKNINAEIDNLNEIYRNQEKQIVLFLDCKKSFFKRLKFFLKKPDKSLKINEVKLKMNKVKISDKQEEIDDDEILEDNEIIENVDIYNITGNYNLSDLIKVYRKYLEVEKKLKNINADIKALENKLKYLSKKVDNAKKYLDEIDEHKKSIFEFWKFTKKDEDLKLNEGEENAVEDSIKIEFDVDEDMQAFANKVDSLQKQKLSIDECNSIFACNYVLGSINSIMIGENEEDIIKEDLDKLKNNYREDKTFEIFGDLDDDYTKIRNLNNKKHRENKKNIYSILRVNDKTTYEEFKNSIENVVRLLNEAYKKITAITDFSVYFNKNNNGYTKAEINPKNLKYDESNIIYKYNVAKDSNILYFSNITYYDNYNKTLPSGMDESTEVLIKLKEKENYKENEINILEEENLYTAKIKKIKVIDF